MTRQKRQRFLQNSLAANVIESGKPLYTSIKGAWNEKYFPKDQPIVLELACGKGEYTLHLAMKCPNKNLIGIDKKGDRIARGSKAAQALGLTNSAFLRTGIEYLDDFFCSKEVSEIWLIHPDPQPKNERKRLTNKDFISAYSGFLNSGGEFHLKTDSTALLDYTLCELRRNPNFEIIDITKDLHNSMLLEAHFGIVTHYEKKFLSLGQKIGYLKAKRK